MASLLDFNTELDTDEFDKIVVDALNPSSPTQKESEAAIMALKEHSHGWLRVDTILKKCKNVNSKYFGLQILEHAIKTRWALFDQSQKASMKQYLVDCILEEAKNESLILNKLNIVLVEVLKKEWPLHWPDFIGSLVQASQTISLSVCRNSLVILKRLNEEVFEFSENSTTIKKTLMQNQLKTEFVNIFNLIKTVLENNKRATLDRRLVETTFESFASFCKWMSPEFLFNTEIVDLILDHLNTNYTVATVRSLKEIVSTIDEKKSKASGENWIAVEENAKHKILLLHSRLITFLNLYFSKFSNTSFVASYPSLSDSEKSFIFETVFLLSALYEKFFIFLEHRDKSAVIKGFGFMREFSAVYDDRIFKRSLDFWSATVYLFYTEFPFSAKNTKASERLSSYIPVFQDLFKILVEKMPRPKEVFVTNNDLGDLVVDKQISVSKIEHYVKMRETIFHLSYLIGEFMREYFKQQLTSLLSGSAYSAAILNRTCWAIGCVSQSFTHEIQREFFMHVIKDLLSLCEIKDSKDEKAVVAANIIYIIGQYHTFLIENKQFLRILVRKLFEFMCESHEGIRDMAVDTFLTVAQKCGPEFFRIKEDDQLLIYEIVRSVSHLTRMLYFHQQRVVYEGICIILNNTATIFRDDAELKIWAQIDILTASISRYNFFADESIRNLNFTDAKLVKELSHLIRSYGLVFKFVPSSTRPFYSSILLKFIDIFSVCGQEQAKGSIAERNSNLIKGDLIEMFIEVVRAKTLNSDFLALLLQNVVHDYKTNMNGLILTLSREIVFCCDFGLENESFLIQTLLVPSFSIVRDPDVNTVVVLEYFKFIDALLEKRFDTFFPNIYQSENFSAFINTILGGISGLKEISDFGLCALQRIVKTLFYAKNFIFFKTYLLSFLENLFALIFDKDKKYNFDSQCSLLCYLFAISFQLPQFTSQSNQVYLQSQLLNTFSSFQNIRPESIEIFLLGTFELCGNEDVFKEHLKDFCIKIYEYDDVEFVGLEKALLDERIMKIKSLSS